MLSSDTLHKVGGVALAAAAAGGLILYINRTRKHMRVRVDGRESLHPFRNLSYTNLSELDKKNLKLRSSSPTHNGQEPDDNSVLSQSEHGGWVNEREEIDSTVPAKTDLLHTGHLRGGKLVICTVGLPGRGKTYMAKKVARYLRWIKYRTRVFSLAKYRLDKMGNKSSEFFNPTNNTFYEQRFESMKLALADAMSYLNHRGEIAIIDGTNVSRDRRDYIRECLSKQDGFEVL